ncbi:MAG: mannose-1-phosphate guanylyltransferase/mannose-6-phosphate isomerase [Gammaproteobacteria bacterium]|nr:mannose-1-phosphate guanylyltransferase/mannose-6-phosphate isomerase [Gammaproteobacteria bacterium]
MKIQPVILSGGSGTRLWPLSRELYPKQLLPLVSNDTMLQETVARLEGIDNVEAPIVVCNEEHRFMVAEQLRQIDNPASNIILEPKGRNTAPALNLAALVSTPETIMLIMPADHVILDIAAFQTAITEAASLADIDYLVTFGITPTGPETGYGYIKSGKKLDSSETAVSINAFVEKPDLATAESYLASGDYFWNSGVFMMKASVWIDAINHFEPEMASSCKMAVEKGHKDQDFFRVDKETFANCPSNSIDYAVMEKLTDTGDAPFKAAMVPLDAGWSDVGIWSALWAVGDKNEQGNVIKGEVFLLNTKNSLLFGQERLLVGIGLENTIVVETTDAVLVADKDHVQDVKKAVEWLKKEKRSEHLTHRRVYRPWGSYESIDVGERYQVKRITVNQGASLSLQMHHHRAEHWIVVKGTAKVTRNDETFLVSENESTYIPIGATHRLENEGAIPLEMIEVQSGSYLGEDDIVRFEDKYGR